MTPAPPASASISHFFEPGGAPLPSYEPAWPVLQDFFGSHLPSRILVEHRDDGTSRFDPERQVIVISRATTNAHSELAVVAHETAHLALANLTRGASATEPFRFLDEGFATIFQQRVEGAAEVYRQRALALAGGRLVTGTVKLEDLQRWSSYFGEPPAADFDAYDVGAAFLFYLEDTDGMAKLKLLLADLARTKELSASLKAVLGRSRDETEISWERYLGRVAVRVPSVVEMLPSNDAVAVASDLHEVHVTFDTDMSSAICIATDCSQGLCYDHAHWTNPRTLAIDVTAPLASGRTHRLSLGVPGRCRLKSRQGVETPVVSWRFSTR